MDHHEIQTKAGRLCPWTAEGDGNDRVYVGVYVDDGASVLDGSTLISWSRCKRDSRAAIVVDSFRQRRPKAADYPILYDNLEISKDSQVTFSTLSTVLPADQIHAILLRAVSPVKACAHAPASAPGQSNCTTQATVQQFSLAQASVDVDTGSLDSFCLQADFRDASPDSSKTAVQEGVSFLNDLQRFFKQRSRELPNAQSWLDQIDQVLAKAIETRTVIGMVAITGAGKSSAANALLDEERLVPTSCMRACTAVITEISYNHGSEPYRAEIDFIDAEDWRYELNILFEEILESKEDVADNNESTSSSKSVPYSKLKAVYPNITKATLKKYTVDDLMADRKISPLLGTRRTIQGQTATAFYRELQELIDSREKIDPTEIRKRRTADEGARAAYWPLIKVVRIYVKHHILKDGLMLVDMPGVHDSNPGRAKAAENYMKTCSGLFIVSPISRAVDDKSATSLLGDRFRRQLKMDGGYLRNMVTFICSKTDDISIAETTEALGLAKIFKEIDDELDPLLARIRVLEKDLKEHNTKLIDLSHTSYTVEQDLDIWQDLSRRAAAGEQVYEPTPRLKRLRPRPAHDRLRKRARTAIGMYAESDDADADAGDRHDIKVELDELDERLPLHQEQISTRLEALSAQRKDMRQQDTEIREALRSAELELPDLHEDVNELTFIKRGRCIRARNEYSTTAIKRDFAAGVRELDQEIAEAEDEDNFDPEADIRDYDQVARDLPVFCVSTRGYQKLCGRLQQEMDVDFFETIEETQIPALQEHCKALTTTDRAISREMFLAALSQLLTSLVLWISRGKQKIFLEGDNVRQKVLVQEGLNQMIMKFDESVASLTTRLETVFSVFIYSRFESAVDRAKLKAPEALHSLHAPVKRRRAEEAEQGGVRWNTYKAICRRDGDFKDYELNAQLTQPLISRLSSNWESCFGKGWQTVIDEMVLQCTSYIDVFHAHFKEHAEELHVPLDIVTLLDNQQSNFHASLRGVATTATAQLVIKQREVNREFIPVIAAAMKHVYSLIVDERGDGCFKRMKQHMLGHVEKEKEIMFQASVDKVQSLLQALIEESKELITCLLHELHAVIETNYLHSIEVVTQGQLEIQRQVLVMVQDSKHVFRGILAGHDVASLREHS